MGQIQVNQLVLSHSKYRWTEKHANNRNANSGMATGPDPIMQLFVCNDDRPDSLEQWHDEIKEAGALLLKWVQEMDTAGAHATGASRGMSSPPLRALSKSPGNHAREKPTSKRLQTVDSIYTAF